MSAIQLQKEFNVVVERALGEARTAILQYLKNNLPTPGGTLGNNLQFPDYTSLAGKNLYATGALRNSYYEITLQRGTPKSGRISSFVTNSNYAYYYANGRINSDTYHGFDFIEQTRKDIEDSLHNVTIRAQIF